MEGFLYAPLIQLWCLQEFSNVPAFGDAMILCLLPQSTWLVEASM